MPNATLKEEAHRLVEQLPDDATWDDVLYQVYVRQSIVAGLEEFNRGSNRSDLGSTATIGIAGMNVNWSATAAAQLQAIRDYLARSSPGYAQALVARIMDRTVHSPLTKGGRGVKKD